MRGRLENFKAVRHSTAYSLDKKEDPEEAKLGLDFAQEFLAKVKKLV